MNQIIKKNIKRILQAIGITGIVIICMYNSSCHITPEGITLITQNSMSPKIKSYKVEGNKITVNFTSKVDVEQSFAVESDKSEDTISSIENFLEAENKIAINCTQGQNDFSIEYNLTQKTRIGKYYELYSVVRNEQGSSLSFALPFFGENDHFPNIVISEVNESYSKKDEISEYVELYAITSGNLFGLSIISASDGREFNLPAAEVNAGEYIVVHLRKSHQNAINETENNLSLSKAPGSVSGARDIWIENSQSVLNSTAEIVILKNMANDILLDCVMYCKQDYALSCEEWKTENLNSFAKLCTQNGIWDTQGAPGDAVFSMQRKSTSYISRKNISQLTDTQKLPNNSNCWIGTTKTKMTPGRQNKW